MESYADLDSTPAGEPRGRSYSRSPPPRSYDEDRSPPPRERDRSPIPAPRNGDDGRRRSPPAPPKPRHAPKNVNPSNILGVFGLSIRTTEADLEDEFGRIAPVAKVVIVYDARSDRSRGFGFVTMQDVDGAEAAIKELNGVELHGRRIRVDFSATKRAHSPTPGEYRGSIRPEDNYRGGPPAPRGGGWGPPPPPPGRYGWGPPPPGWGGGYGRYGPPPPERWGPPPPVRGARGYGPGAGGPPGGYGPGFGPDAADDWRRRPSPPRRGGDRGRDLSPAPRSRRHRDSPSPPSRRRDSRSPPRRRDDGY